MNSVIYQIIDEVNCSKKIAVIGHENPDGDAVGSVLGLCRVLSNMGKQVKAIFPNDAPYFLHWLKGYSEALIFKHHTDEVRSFLQDVDIVFFLDFNEIKRAGILKNELENIASTKILIDHHPYPEAFFDILISDIQYSSTSELVYETIGLCDWLNYLDRDAAECIYTGIVTDTLSFTVNSSRPKTLEIASKLLHFGLNNDEIHTKVFNNFSLQRMRMLGYALHKKMKILPEYATGYIYLSKEELKEFCFQPGDTEGFVNYPMQIKGIRMAGLFLERDGYIKISLRSIGDIPVNEIIAKHFSGGGHKNAAGGEAYNMSLSDFILKFESILSLYKDILTKHENN